MKLDFSFRQDRVEAKSKLEVSNGCTILKERRNWHVWPVCVPWYRQKNGSEDIGQEGTGRRL